MLSNGVQLDNDNNHKWVCRYSGWKNLDEQKQICTFCNIESFMTKF
jgi:hypothetical protein